MSVGKEWEIPPSFVQRIVFRCGSTTYAYRETSLYARNGPFSQVLQHVCMMCLCCCSPHYVIHVFSTTTMRSGQHLTQWASSYSSIGTYLWRDFSCVCLCVYGCMCVSHIWIAILQLIAITQSVYIMLQYHHPHPNTSVCKYNKVNKVKIGGLWSFKSIFLEATHSPKCKSFLIL